jgi:hypothetical protein
MFVCGLGLATEPLPSEQAAHHTFFGIAFIGECMSVESLTKEITTIDEYGFEFRPWSYWLPESLNDKISRLEMNQSLYRERIKLGTKFPPKVNQERLDEYKLIQELKNVRQDI